VPFNQFALLSLHSLILRSIDPQYAGRYRDIPVTISGSRHVPPQPWQVEKLMEDYFLFYQQQSSQLHPVILAAEMHEQLVTIHSFVDGNGRTARLVMNLILMQYGFPIAIFHGDNDARFAYYDALEQCNLNDDKAAFHELVAEQVLASLEQRLKLVEVPDS
jgi:Fic family protein